MSVSLLGAPPSKTSGAGHRMPSVDRVVLPRGLTNSSGIGVSRLNPAKQARPLLLIRILDLRIESALRRR